MVGKVLAMTTCGTPQRTRKRSAVRRLRTLGGRARALQACVDARVGLRVGEPALRRQSVASSRAPGLLRVRFEGSGGLHVKHHAHASDVHAHPVGTCGYQHRGLACVEQVVRLAARAVVAAGVVVTCFDSGGAQRSLNLLRALACDGVDDAGQGGAAA